MAQWHDAKVTQRIDWNDHLFSLRFKCPEFPSFTAGQFTKVGLEQADGKVLSRPYSLVNEPNADELEIVAVPVAQGSLSPKLHELSPGASLKVMSPATGFLVIDEVPKSETLFLVATGTGVGPFLSMLATSQPWQKYQNIVLVYAARYRHDLAYTDKISEWQKAYPDRFNFVPIVSREMVEGTLQGRIPQLFASGKIQSACNLQLNPETCQVMLCGNPEMIKECLIVLEQKGLNKHLRRSPGQISMERYW